MNSSFTGQVIRGAQVGSKFGIATANLGFEILPELEEGVYLIDITNIGGGLLHFGTRKTFGAEFSAEVHILDFNQDIYGATLEVSILKKLREVQAFQNADALFTQIETDILMAQKFFIRRKIKREWEKVDHEPRAIWADKAVSQIESLLEFQSAKVIYAYAPDDQEIPFVEKLCKKYPEKTWCFPRIENGEMSFFPSTYQDLRPGYLNLLEPDKGALALAPDIILVPAVAASLTGQRLGRGGGFYDRFLSNTKAPTICTLPAFAILDEVPVEKHDQLIDKIIEII